MPMPSLAPALSGATSSRDVQRREDWKEYVDNTGKTYYHNVVTKETTWSKPAILIDKSDLVKLQRDAWTEFISPEGKVYYHNSVTGETKWVRPAGLPDKATAAAASPPTPAPPVDPATRRARLQAFQEMLEDYDIDPDLPWVEALNRIINDPRFKAIKSLGEKKACYTEYCERQRRARKDQQVIERKRAREGFMAMLAGCPELTLSTPWKKAQLLFVKDPRLHAIATEREREALYEDHAILLERRERELDKGRRKERMAKFRQLLEETKAVGAGAQWRRVQELLDQDPRFQATSKMDRLIVFEDYLKELEKKEENLRAKEKEERKKQEKLMQEEFRTLLRDYSAKGLLDYTTKWTDFAQLVASDSAFDAIMAQGLAHDMFDDWIEELEERFRKEYKRIKQALESMGYTLKLGVDFEAFDAQLAHAEGLEDISPHSRRLAYDALYAKEEEREREREKKHKKAVDRLFAALNALPAITPDMTYSEAQPHLQPLAAFQAIESEAERQAVFCEHVQRLQAREAPAKRKAPPDAPSGKVPRLEKKSPASPVDGGPAAAPGSVDLEARRQEILRQLLGQP